MKILAIHADFIEFAAKKKAFKGAEEGVEKGQQEKVEECLVIFTAVEKRDENDLLTVKERYIREIKNIAQQVNAQNIVLYPYAHLSSSLASPKIAEQFMKDAQIELSQKYKVSRAPFGWYKSFNISCKGHPLSELSREFGPVDDGTGENKPVVTQPVVEVKEEVTTNLKREFEDEAFKFNSNKLTEDQKLKLTAAYLLASILKKQNANLQVGSAGFYHDQAYIDVTVKVDTNSLKSLEKQLRNEVMEVVQGGELDDLQKDVAKDLNDQVSIFSLNDLSFVPFQFLNVTLPQLPLVSVNIPLIYPQN